VIEGEEEEIQKAKGKDVSAGEREKKKQWKKMKGKVVCG
jgi:hypothetical protein